MKILFYSTNSNTFNGSEIIFSQFPNITQELFLLCKNHPEHEFIVATQLPGKFLIDANNVMINGDNSLGILSHKNQHEKTPENLKLFLIEKDDLKSQVKFLAGLSPNVAIAASFWEKPYDWLSLKDSMIGEELIKLGIKVFVTPSKIQHMLFDKSLTHTLLEPLGIKMPDSIKVDHNLFFCAGNRKEIKTNVYREFVLSKIKSMKFPLVIKDTTGLSSYGMEVVNNYNEAYGYLHSKKNSGDRIVEELICGNQFGLEIWTLDSAPVVLDPYIFSTNRYGITSPKQSIKLGPVPDEKFKITELKKQMSYMAEKIGLKGPCQVDLVFDGLEWYVIELNPRLSGMTETYASQLNCSVLELLFKTCTDSFPDPKNFLDKRLNIKLPLLTEEKLKNLSLEENIDFVFQIENLAARQEREKGYCEIIIKDKIKETLNHVYKKYCGTQEEIFLEKAEILLNEIL